jgi:hypothetical protein
MTAGDRAGVVPQNDEAEDWVIGSILKHPGVVGELLDPSPRRLAEFC